MQKQSTLCFHETLHNTSLNTNSALIEEAEILFPTNNPLLYEEWLPSETILGPFHVVAEEAGEKSPAGHAWLPVKGQRVDVASSAFLVRSPGWSHRETQPDSWGGWVAHTRSAYAFMCAAWQVLKNTACNSWKTTQILIFWFKTFSFLTNK